MRRLCLITVFAGVLLSSVAATAAIRVTVTPLAGTPTTKFTVSFVVDRKLSADRWFVVEVDSPVPEERLRVPGDRGDHLRPQRAAGERRAAAGGQDPLVSWRVSRGNPSPPPYRMWRTGARSGHVLQERARRLAIQLHGRSLSTRELFGAVLSPDPI